MEDEYTSKARPLLEILHWWKKAHEHTVPIRVHVTDRGNFSEAIQITKIAMLSSIRPSNHSGKEYVQPPHPKMTCLRRAFRLPHSTLKVYFVGSPDHQWRMSVCEVQLLIVYLHGLDEGLPVFGETERVVFQLKSCKIDANDARKTSHGFLRAMNREPSISRNPPFKNACRTWIARERKSEDDVLWAFGYDYTKGLSEFTGTVQEGEL
jgi:hypothetical protein